MATSTQLYPTTTTREKTLSLHIEEEDQVPHLSRRLRGRELGLGSAGPGIDPSLRQLLSRCYIE